MSPDDLDEVVRVAREGAAQAAAQQPDVEAFDAVAQFVGGCLEAEDDVTLVQVERRLRAAGGPALSWYLTIVRTLAGTVPEGRLMHHLVLLPAWSGQAFAGPLLLGSARHEIEGSLETALNLGVGTLRLLPHLVSFAAIEAMQPSQWRHLVEGRPDADDALGTDSVIRPPGGALVGRWSIEQRDQARLVRKLVHATQRTPALVQFQQRAEALLEERAPGARLAVYPALQLQDFYAGFRQVQFVRELEEAFRELPEAQALHWQWADDVIRCQLVDPQQRSREVRVRFPDELPALVQTRLKGFCDRRRLVLAPAIALH